MRSRINSCVSERHVSLSQPLTPTKGSSPTCPLFSPSFSLLHFYYADNVSISSTSLTMPVDMHQHISESYVPSYDQFRPPNPAKGQRKGKVHSFLPSFVDRAIFRAKPAAYRDTAESHPEVDPATNVDSLATKSRVLRHIQAQFDRTETQKSRMANKDLRTSLVIANKERKAVPQALDKEQRHSRAIQEQFNLDRKVTQSEVSEIIQSYDSKLRDMNELNMRQGAQVIKLQSKLFDRDEHIARLESLEMSNPVVETIAPKTSARNLESASQVDTCSQGRVIEVQAITEHQSKPGQRSQQWLSKGTRRRSTS
ncbi:hypothetical protein EV702DRAFT_1255340 [Suillus placidus]|uniref:Uncharacterized protein n=1 Tax=Suillus placidus TaxID=48579 RepID=A0A9P6ZIL8_9AGAM|nr:hypothetical protein EV702DRAFT_1255340 [Suillus placidus]